MVEFALCFPILLLFAISAIGLNHAVETSNNLATVVRDGARYAGLYPAAYGCPGGASATSCGANTIQGAIQIEATSVNAAAGGTTLANYNCLWGGSATPPSFSASASPPAVPTNASQSCITIAYYAADTSGTTACAYYATATSSFTNVNSKTCTATSSTTTPLYVQVTVAVAQAATGNPMVTLLNGLRVTPLMTESYAMEVVP
jgi:Flp pilus assembly protein TadG